MAVYNWKGGTVGTTGQDWGHTFANWLNGAGAAVTSFPKGGDIVIFGARAISACLFGGLTNGLWPGYTAGDAGSTTDIEVIIEPGFGITHPNGVPQVGYSAGTGGLELRVSSLYIGTTYNAQISIENYPVTDYSLAQVNGLTATFYASGKWKNIIVTRGSLTTENLTSGLISIEGIRGTTYYHLGDEGYGVDTVRINGNSNIGAISVSAKATKNPMIVNTVVDNCIINGMGGSAAGYTCAKITQNVRAANLESQQ